MRAALTGTSATFGVERMRPVEGTITAGGSVQGGGKPNFAVPFPGTAALYLRRS